MNFKTYTPLALRTCKQLATPKLDLDHAALGLMTESGEFATEVKRAVVYGCDITDEMLVHMREEIGDVMWYVPLALRVFGLDDLPVLKKGEQGRVLQDFNGRSFSEHALMLHSATGVVSAAALLYGTPDWDAHEALETARICTVIIMLCDKIAVEYLGSHGDLLRADNIEKLRKRYPDAYSDAAAEARADKGGLDARSS